MKSAPVVLLFVFACNQSTPIASGGVGPVAVNPRSATVRQAPPLSGSLQVAPVATIGSTPSLRIAAAVTGAAGPTSATLDLISPRGEMYQRQVETLFGSAFDAQSVVFELPVAGTVIDTHALAGTWTAALTVNGAEIARQTFELQP